jgi:toxin ParE1/3/4
MTARYAFRPRAKTDLKGIWIYTEKRWGREQARAYTDQLRRHIEAIVAQPNSGQTCPEIRSGYYRYPSGSHILFYRLTLDGIEIVRILHERMDFMQHL